ATWRVTHLVTAEDGPWNTVARLRRLAGAGALGDLMDCFYCASLWVALPFAFWLHGEWVARGVLWLAISGGAIVIDKALPKPPAGGI
ncbi:MAG TPA: DUF1360 domain-containing protein, partial [Rhizobacter sp.]|nr:DUF1360 domain-containing protein [Rhizobacter sp.]